jgi:tetratricopeptide (TPR) repeat protein
VTYFERAVRVDPQYAQAWGALALSYTHGLDGFSEAQLASLPGRIRSAAARALALDADNADAQLALACIPPYFRNWRRMEPELRRIRDRFPDHWLANGRLAILYYQVGRFIDGAKLHKHVIDIDPMISPGPYAFAATALSNAGHIQEADDILHDARDRWPAHPVLWHVAYAHLLFSGRPASAAALLMDPEAIPSGVGKGDVEALLTLARAVDRRQPQDVESALNQARGAAQSAVRAIADVVPVFALLGRPDLVFDSLDRYFLNRGSFGTPSPIGPYTRRYTDFLFSMPMAAVRSEERFGSLTKAIGLDDYWQATATRPEVLR